MLRRLLPAARGSLGLPGAPRLRRRARPLSSTNRVEDDVAAAVRFVEERGYAAPIAAGIVNALQQPGSGVSPGGCLRMVTSMAGSWEIGEGDEALKAMAAAVEREVALTEGREKVSFVVSPPRGSGAPFTVVGFEGASLQAVIEGPGAAEPTGARLLAEYLECACSGVAACSTCHVHVDEEWYAKVGEPSENEQDMLDLAADLRPTSRLACQLVLGPDLQGLRLTVPDDANNLFDDIPFE